MMPNSKSTAYTLNSSNITLPTFCFLCSLLFIPASVFSQEMRTNDQGEQIIVHEDGTWQFFADYLNGDKERNPATVAEPTNPYPVFEGTIEPLEGNIKITEEDLFKISVRRAQLAGEAAQIAQKRWAKAEQARAEIEKELQRQMTSGQRDETAITHLKNRLAAAQRTEADSKFEAQDAVQESDRASFMTQKGQFVLAAYKEAQKQRLANEEARREASKARSYEQALPLSDNYVGGTQQDLILNPPPTICKVAHEGIDPKTGMFRKDLAQQFLFSHTDDRLRVYLKDKEYLRCEGYFSAKGGYRFLTLAFTFAYPNAREAYGFIEKGSILTIKLLNGDFVNLRSGVMDRGSYDTESELLTYRVYYPIDRSQMTFLKNGEVDAIRVFWSSGFEEYEVYHLDFFSNQLKCID